MFDIDGINVLKVQDITQLPCIERELLLIKVSANPKNRSEILEIANVFRAKPVDLADESVTLEITGDPGKIYALKTLLEKFGILEIARTGKISLPRDSKINTEFLKEIEFENNL